MESVKLSKRDIEFLEDTLAEFALSSAVALMPALITSVAIPAFFVPTLVLVAGLVVLGVGLKIHLRGGDWKAGIGDSLVSLVHSEVIS